MARFTNSRKMVIDVNRPQLYTRLQIEFLERETVISDKEFILSAMRWK